MPGPRLDTDDIAHLRVQFQAWMDGAHARFLGIKLCENPHPPRSAAGDAWEAAWETTDDGISDRDGFRVPNFSGTGRLLQTIADEQAVWSQQTFGTDAVRGPVGPLKHLQREAQEAIDKPDDPVEYADCLLLTLDASRRAGISALSLLATAYAKLQLCKSREWVPTALDEPSRHVRDDGSQPYVSCVVTKLYNPLFGDNRICECGHSYAKHFDLRDDECVGCAYCRCEDFKLPVVEA